MPKGKGAGTGLYLEFRRSTYTNQFILIPQFLSPLERKVMNVTMIHRQVTKDNPKKPWKFRREETAVSGTRDIDPATGLIKRTMPLEVAFQEAAHDLATYNLHMQAMINGGWTLYQTPLGIEYTDVDLKDIARFETPQALMRRVENARSEAGFDKLLYNVES